jgi:hypothetical protein
MLASVLLFIPVFVCGALGAAVGYVFRYRPQSRRIAPVATAVVIFIVLEIISGALTSKNTVVENLTEQLA